MEKIIFLGLTIPILAFVLYLGATAIMKGFSAKNANKSNDNDDYNYQEKQNFIDENDKVCYYEPNDFDLLIFPNYLKHKPVASKLETRISLNLELECLENVNSIFKNEKTKLNLKYE